MGAELGVKQPQAKEPPEPRNLRRRAPAPTTRFQESGPWSCVRMNFCCFKPPWL